MHDSAIPPDKDLSLAEMICSRCKEPIDALDRFCRHCGGKRGSKGALYHRPMVVLGLLFFVVGPLALPLLWRSETFTRNQKIGVTIANLAFIGGIVVAMLAVFRAYMKMILDMSMG
jgi:hypothetical protein